MEPTPYSNREINNFITDMRQSLARTEQSLSNIEVQLTKVERRLFWWHGAGAATVLILTLIIIPALAWLYVEFFTLSSTLDKAHHRQRPRRLVFCRPRQC
jgi:hypothetical protein